MIRFNPRPREGATLPCLGDGGGSRCFNPRPREGATSRAWEMVEVPDVSIHAPVKGRLDQFEVYGTNSEFQSTPP